MPKKIIHSTHDKFKGLTTSTTDKIMIGGDMTNQLHLRIRHIKQNEQESLLFDAFYQGENWIFLRRGELYFSVDEEVFKLKANRNYNDVIKNRDRNSKVKVEESTFYNLSRQLLEKICSGTNVEAKITGEKINQEIWVDKFQILCQQFYNNFYDNTKYVESLNKKTKGCFIATATYGNYNHPQVIEFRTFRDNYLQKYLIGKLFISMYYAVSPFIARIIEESEILRNISRKYLLEPLLTFVRRL